MVSWEYNNVQINFEPEGRICRIGLKKRVNKEAVGIPLIYIKFWKNQSIMNEMVLNTIQKCGLYNIMLYKTVMCSITVGRSRYIRKLNARTFCAVVI